MSDPEAKFTPCRFCGDPLQCGDVCDEGDCQAELSREWARASYKSMASAAIPPLYRLGFDHSIMQSKTMGEISEMGKKWAAGFSRKTRKGLYLSSSLGYGKTGLACSIGLAVGERRWFIAFTTVADLLRSYQSAFGAGEGSPEEIERELLEKDLVILDDFGAEPPTVWAASCLQLLIDKVSRNMRPVLIVTGNYTIKQAMDRYRTGEGAHNMRRALSRLEGIVEVVNWFPAGKYDARYDLRKGK